MKRTYIDLAGKILINCRNELYQYFPYLDGAFASLEYDMLEGEEVNQVNGIASDGVKIYVWPEFLVKIYAENPVYVKRGYLHILLHCLYLHMFPVSANRNERLWNLACDMAVERILDRELPSVFQRKTTDAELESICCQACCGKHLLDIYLGETGKKMSAEQIYQMLERESMSYSLEELECYFSFDDHSIWRQMQKDDVRKKLRIKWERIVSYTLQNKQDGQNRRGSQAGDTKEMLDVLKPGKYDYRKYLKKFASLREEVELDTENFDYIFYHYGMEQYGNLPLIEPLEYKEVNRLEELVIAIDTSGSCSREMVQQFLDETYRIFSEKENFFRKMKVHILQCDCHLQEAVVIHSEEEWKAYSKNVVISGRSGTNFRPVFRYVEEQRKKKEIKNLKALIYFTDGDGVFPEKTDYETAFVFVKKCECMDLIPSWITKLFIYQE